MPTVTLTFSPCHGRLPRKKYINMWPSASRSSRRLCSLKKLYISNASCNRPSDNTQLNKPKSRLVHIKPLRVKCQGVCMCRSTFSQMCVDGHVTCCAGQTLVFSVRYVFFSLWVDVFFCKTKVNYVDDVLLFTALTPN